MWLCTDVQLHGLICSNSPFSTLNQASMDQQLACKRGTDHHSQPVNTGVKKVEIHSLCDVDNCARHAYGMRGSGNKNACSSKKKTRCRTLHGAT